MIHLRLNNPFCVAFPYIEDYFNQCEDFIRRFRTLFNMAVVVGGLSIASTALMGVGVANQLITTHSGSVSRWWWHFRGRHMVRFCKNDYIQEPALRKQWLLMIEFIDRHCPVDVDHINVPMILIHQGDSRIVNMRLPIVDCFIEVDVNDKPTTFKIDPIIIQGQFMGFDIWTCGWWRYENSICAFRELQAYMTFVSTSEYGFIRLMSHFNSPSTPEKTEIPMKQLNTEESKKQV